MSGLAGKTALVTGGARGIGFAVAQSLGVAGVRVFLADINEVGAQEAAARLQSEGVEAIGVGCDVGDKAQVVGAVEAAVAAFGRLDITVANAGIAKTSDFMEMSEDDWDTVIRINLKGVFLTGQVASRQMVAQGGGGVIVNMSSVNAVTAIPTICSYNAAKGGVNNLTRSMALALAPHNIRVNAVGPGSIRTEMFDAVVADPAAKAKVLSRTPMLRPGEPSEIGSVVRFLASDDASYITGQILYADGGRLALNYTVPVPED